LTIFNLAALIAGKNPPTTPITTANIKQEIIIEELRANVNESSENEFQFNVESEKN